MRGAGDAVGIEAAGVLDQAEGLGIDLVHEMHRPAFQRGHARRRVVDRQHLDRIDEATIGIPVVRIAPGDGADAGLESIQDIGAGADGFVGRRALGHDPDMVVGQDIGQVGVPIAQGDGHLVVVGRGNIGDLVEQGARAGLGLLAAVMIDGIDHVGGLHLLAVVKRHPLAQLDDPDLGAGLGLPTDRQRRLDLVLDVELGQRVVELRAEDLRIAGRVVGGIERVGAAGVVDAEDEGSAALRRLRLHRFGGKAAGERRGDAVSRRLAHELPPVDAPAGQLLDQILDVGWVLHRCRPPVAIDWSMAARGGSVV